MNIVGELPKEFYYLPKEQRIIYLKAKMLDYLVKTQNNKELNDAVQCILLWAEDLSPVHS